MPSTYSPLRYPGGKSKFYDYIREILKCNNLIGETYIEPFAGGAGLALKLLLNNDVKRIVINDFDPAIYSLWYSILYETDAFCDLIDSTPITLDEWKNQRNTYMDNSDYTSLKLGFATFYLNRTNVSGVIKGGVIGGQEQTGTYKMDARFNKKNLIKKIMKISGYRDQIVLLNQDAKELLQPQQLRKFYKSFINLDPPYVKKGTQLYKNAFIEKDHRDLCKLISECNRKWVVTYDICPLIAELYKKYRSSYLDVTYSIQISKKAQEYIFLATIYNYQILSHSENKKIVKQRAKHFCIINLFAVIGSLFFCPLFVSVDDKDDLAHLGFVQISKSCVLNINALDNIKPLMNSRMEATLKNGEKIHINRKYLSGVKQALKGEGGI